MTNYPYHTDLIETLRSKGIIKSDSVLRTMLKVDRGLFCHMPAIHAYDDRPQKIGHSATISAPHMHAHALELLRAYLLPHSVALDIGSGSGYFTVCMSEMMNNTGKVIGVDHIPELISISIENIRTHDPLLLESSISMVLANGTEGYLPGAPYKAIHVGAAAPALPAALLSQLDFEGRIVIPLGCPQYLYVIDKNADGSVTTTKCLRVNYIPLIG